MDPQLDYKMPFSGRICILPSKTLDYQPDEDEEIEGVIYGIYWNNAPLPWCTKTQIHAHAIAVGCQYGANQIAKRFEKK